MSKKLKTAVNGRIILITGASAGIGKATALKLAETDAQIILVARTESKLIATQKEIEAKGGIAHVISCNLSDLDAIDALVEEVNERFGHVDILINNAGRSIRRSIRNAYDRFHDYQRTMQLNYFAPVKLMLGLLPAMSKRKKCHVINISSIAVLSKTPRFSAYAASKAALDVFSDCAANELHSRKVAFTNIHMPLVRTEMIAPTDVYKNMPVLSVEQAADLVCKAIIKRPKSMNTMLGRFAIMGNLVFPKGTERVMNQGYHFVPEDAPENTSASQLPEQSEPAGSNQKSQPSQQSKKG